MESEAVQHCLNCQREVSQLNFTMHVVHCARHILICAECEEPIPRLEFEDHKKKFHEKIACEQCKKIIEKGRMPEHAAEDCSFRTIPCEFCQLDCFAAELSEHEQFCGSRTDTCSTCGTFVMISHLAEHEKSHSSPSKNVTKPSSIETSFFYREESMEDVFLPCEVCGELFPADVLAMHQAICVEEEEPTVPVEKGWPGKNNSHAIFGMENEKPVNARPMDRDEDEQLNVEEAESFVFGSREPFKDISAAEEVPCEFCSMMFDYTFIAEHELTCSKYKAQTTTNAIPNARETFAAGPDDPKTENLSRYAAPQPSRGFMKLNSGRVAENETLNPGASHQMKKPDPHYYHTKDEEIDFAKWDVDLADAGKNLTRAGADKEHRAAKQKETGAIPKKPKDL